MNIQTVPHIIHQTWKSNNLSDSLKRYQQSWQRHHPDWEYRFWTDLDNEALVKKQFPEYWDWYQNYPYMVQKVDLMRLLILRQYGGILADIDLECLRPLDGLVEPGKLVMGREYGGIGYRERGKDYIWNGLIITPPNHPFIDTLIDLMKKRFAPKPDGKLRNFYILKTTGPIIVEEAVDAYEGDDIVIHPSEMFFPTVTFEKSERRARRIAIKKNAYTVHHNANSWFPFWMKAVSWIIYIFEIRLGFADTFIPFQPKRRSPSNE